MSATTEQKVDFLLKKVGFTLSKTGSVTGTGAISGGTTKEPFAESLPSPLVVPDSSIWNQSLSIPTTPPGSDTAIVKVYSTSSAHRMTADSSVSGSRAFIAYSTYNNTSSARLTDWIDTQFGTAYVLKVYKGDPNSGGTLLPAGGSGSNDGWFFDYSSGVLNFNGSGLPSGVTDTNIYIVGYRYIGSKGVSSPASINPTNLFVAGISTFVGVGTFQSDLSIGSQLKGFTNLVAPHSATTKTFTVTVQSKDASHRYNGTGSGNAYLIDGIQAPVLTLTPGRTYRFTNDNTGSHPLKFYLEADKTTNYTTGVNFQNTYTEITIGDETPNVLHYQCTSHAYMGNAIITNSNVVNSNYTATLRGGLSVTGGETTLSSATVSDLTDNRVVIAGTSGALEDSANLTFNGSQLGITGTVNASSTITGTEFHTGASGSAIRVTSNSITGPAEMFIDPAGVGVNTGRVRIKGDLFVDGTTFSVHNGDIEFGDFVVGIASTVPTNALLDGAGIGIGSTGIRKFIRYNHSASSLKSSEHLDVASGKVYKVNGTEVLSATTLGSGVVNSSLTSVGTLTSLDVSGNVSVGNSITATGLIQAAGGAGNGIKIGNSLRITDAANTQIAQQNNASIYLNADNIELRNRSVERFLVAGSAAGNAVGLYHYDGSSSTEKFRVTSSGVTVTGTVVADGADINGSLDVSGHAGIGSFTVAGVSTFSDDVTFLGTNPSVSANKIIFDKSSNHIQFFDSTKAKFGQSGDLEIYHQSGINYIDCTTSAQLLIQSDDLRIRNAAGSKEMLIATADAGIDLYFNTVKKLATDVGGVIITGVTTSSGGFSGNLTGNVTGNVTGTASLATDLAINGTNQIVYQDSNNDSDVLPTGNVGQILASSGAGAAPQWVNSAPAGAIEGITIREESSVVGSANSISTINFIGQSVTADAAVAAGIATITIDAISGVLVKEDTANVGTAITAFDFSGSLVDVDAVSNTGIATVQIDGLTIKDEGSTVGTAGSITTINFVGTGIAAAVSGDTATVTSGGVTNADVVALAIALG